MAKDEEKLTIEIHEKVPEGKKEIHLKYGWFNSFHIPIEFLPELIDELENLDKQLTIKKP